MIKTQMPIKASNEIKYSQLYFVSCPVKVVASHQRNEFKNERLKG